MTGAVLRSFLLQEAGRWELERDLGKTAIFRRVTDGPVARGVWWEQQPWGAAPVVPEKLRHVVRQRLHGVVRRWRAH